MSTIEYFAATARGRDPRHEDSGSRLVEPFTARWSFGVVYKAVEWGHKKDAKLPLRIACRIGIELQPGT